MDQNQSIQQCLNLCLYLKLSNSVNSLGNDNNKYAIKYFYTKLNEQQQENSIDQYDNKSKYKMIKSQNIDNQNYDFINKMAFQKIMKSKKKQSTVKKKKKPKFQKLNNTMQIIQKNQISQSESRTPQKYNQRSHSKSPINQYMNAKSLLLHTQSLHKFKNNSHHNDSADNFTDNGTNTFSNLKKSITNSIKTDQNYRSLSPSTITKQQYISPVSNFKQKSSYGISLNDSGINYSPCQEFNTSKQINVIKHSNKMKPSISNMTKKKDVIQIMEKVKQAKNKEIENKKNSQFFSTSNVNNKKQYKTPSPNSREEKFNQNEPNYVISQSKLDKLYIKSVGNKYIQLVIQNYKNQKR